MDTLLSDEPERREVTPAADTPEVERRAVEPRHVDYALDEEFTRLRGDRKPRRFSISVFRKGKNQ